MLDSLLYRSAHIEVMSRRVLAKFPKIKSAIKAKLKKSSTKERTSFDESRWNEYRTLVDKTVKDNSIILVHASMDGFNSIGIDENRVLELLLSFVERGVTVVSTAYPITNLKADGNKMRPFNPAKTPCWTGMLSNRFVSNPMSIRSAVPYNSLAAIGPLANEMMNDNLLADYVYGEHTPWKYCVEHHARILFLGTTCLESNTIQTHMLADYMGEKWPIDNWYEVFDAPIKINGEIVNKKLNIQSNFWTQFVADYASTRKIKEKGLLKEFEVGECPFGYITDSYDLIEYLKTECNRGNLTYIIPKKYWKKGWKK